MGKKKILVVDDESIVRRTLEKLLTEENYDVVCASDGKTSLKNLANDNFDLVLLDIKLNEIDGIKTLERLRTIDKNIPVILISGYLTIETIAKASEFCIFSYIRKPFQIQDLREKIKRALFRETK